MVLAAEALTSPGGAYLLPGPARDPGQHDRGAWLIALAAAIFGDWRPARVAVACVLFAAARTLQIQLQGLHLIPSQFVKMIPYVLPMVALAPVTGRAVPPAAPGSISA